MTSGLHGPTYHSIPTLETTPPQASTTAAAQHLSNMDPQSPPWGQTTGAEQRLEKPSRFRLTRKSLLFAPKRLFIALFRWFRRHRAISTAAFCVLVILAFLLIVLLAVTINARNETIAVLSSGATDSGVSHATTKISSIYVNHLYLCDPIRLYFSDTSTR